METGLGLDRADVLHVKRRMCNDVVKERGEKENKMEKRKRRKWRRVLQWQHLASPFAKMLVAQTTQLVQTVV